MAHMTSRLRVLTFLLCVTTICVLFTEPNSWILQRNLLQRRDANSCSCRKCQKEGAENYTWFMKHFNQSVEPFLTAKSYLSEDAFNWWKSLQREKRNFTTYRETLNMLFQIFPPNPYFLAPRPQQCRTCAVVGNSVNLKGSHYGSLIDANDVIIRINRGQIKGYEADVGSRTTHRVMYPESATDLDNTTYLVLFPFKIPDFEWLIEVFSTRFSTSHVSDINIKSNITANKDLVMVINPAFMMYVHDKWLDKKGKYPSTGFLALVLALHICDKIHVFGYGADKDGNWSHYWEKLEDKNLKTGVHPGPEEYEMIQKLDKQQKLKFYTGL